MSVHASRNWKAFESTDLTGGDRKLTVTGDVEVGATNQEPVLTKAVPQGINPRIDILDLSTTACGDAGAEVLTWKEVTYEEPIEEDQFGEVDIRGHALVEVERVLS